MLRSLFAFTTALALTGAIAYAADTRPVHANLTAAEIAGKNIAARGGLEAWRAVHTLSESGKLSAGGNQRAAIPTPVPGGQRPGKQQALASSSRLKEEAQLPFLMELERPRKVRLEIQFRGQTAIQVYDGSNGWKLRPYLNRLEVEPFTSDELKLASMQSDLDGPLVDYAAKGTRLELVGTEKVEDRDTYNLKLTQKTGQATHVWIDAQTFLEAKVEGQPRRLDGKLHPVEVYYRDYRSVSGLQIPFLLETRVLPAASSQLKEPPIPPEKIVIDEVVVNPKLEVARFSKPQIASGAGPR